jgi:hypothetical protein
MGYDAACAAVGVKLDEIKDDAEFAGWKYVPGGMYCIAVSEAWREHCEDNEQDCQDQEEMDTLFEEMLDLGILEFDEYQELREFREMEKEI